MALFDEFVYPFHSPEAQYLHQVLTGLYPGDGALLAARQAEIDTGMISPKQGPTLLWKDILDGASRAGQLRVLVQFEQEPVVQAGLTAGVFQLDGRKSVPHRGEHDRLDRGAAD